MSKFLRDKKCEICKVQTVQTEEHKMRKEHKKTERQKGMKTGEQEKSGERKRKIRREGEGIRRGDQEGRGQVKPAALMASEIAAGAAVPVTLTRPVGRSTVTVSTPGRARRVFSTVALQWLQAIPFTLLML